MKIQLFHATEQGHPPNIIGKDCMPIHPTSIIGKDYMSLTALYVGSDSSCDEYRNIGPNRTNWVFDVGDAATLAFSIYLISPSTMA